MPTYYIKIWEWDVDEQEYFPKHITASDDYESIKMVFDTITVNNGRPQVELWEIKKDRDERIAYKDIREEDR